MYLRALFTMKLMFICAILFTIVLVDFECTGEDMKTTLLGSDLYDLNLKNEGNMKYRLLSEINDTLFIGGKDVLMTIPINHDSIKKRVLKDPEFNITSFTVCIPKNDISCTRQNKEDACFNYIRVFNVMNDSKMFVCGSNALYPRCYHLNYEKSEDNEFEIYEESTSFECINWERHDNTGVDFTPFTWDSEMIHLFSDNSSEMFSGGARGVEDRDSVICHISFADGYPSSRICTAVGSDFLNKANYVGEPIKRNGHTYFFFREFAKEYINHGKKIYSRVGRICNDDSGGTHDSLDGKLISFIKARLDCSISGDYDPFFFNELKDIYQSTNDSNIVYAVFTTPKLGLQQSAVCRFDLANIEEMMNTDIFRGQTDIKSLWLTWPNLAYRPGVCSSDPIPPAGYNDYWKVNLIDPFVKNQHLVKTSILPIIMTPTPMFILQNAIYTSIVVEDRLTDVKVYILGTDNSTVYMAYEDEGQGKIFHKIDLKKSDEEPDEVTDLSLHYYENSTFVYGTTNDRVFGYQLANCGRYTEISCRSNPYCMWKAMQCSSVLKEDDDFRYDEKKEESNSENYEEFTSQAVCENDTVVLKFAQNSPVTCLKKKWSMCRFYLVATVKNSNQDELIGKIEPENIVHLTTRSVNGVLFRNFYYAINVEVNENTANNYTFRLDSTLCSLEFEVSLDNSDTVNIKGSDSFLDNLIVFDEKVEKYRYCLYRWPQDYAETCQSRITRQEKKGVKYFPRSMNSPCV